MPAPKYAAENRRLMLDVKRRCTKCEKVKWLTRKDGTANFHPQFRNADGSVGRWHAWCVTCKVRALRHKPKNQARVNAQAREQYRRTMADPERRAKRRKREREAARRRRAAAQSKPEVARVLGAAHRRWMEKLKADPERYQAFLESRRIAYWLRREREGKPLRPALESAPRRGGNMPVYPVEPFARWLDALGEKIGSRSADVIALACGGLPRRVYAYINRTQDWVSLDAVDAALLHEGGRLELDGRRSSRWTTSTRTLR